MANNRSIVVIDTLCPAEQMGISTTAMTAICNNKSQPHLKDLKRMTEILGVDIQCRLLKR